MINRQCWHWAAALFVLAAIAGHPLTGGAAAAGLAIELNKVEDSADNTCVAALVLRNDMSDPLDRFSLDLYVFDSDGIIARQLVLDLAPLRAEKTTVVRFPLLDRPCATISRVLINDIPSCRAGGATGQDLDCLAALSVSSRDRVGLTK